MFRSTLFIIILVIGFLSLFGTYHLPHSESVNSLSGKISASCQHTPTQDSKAETSSNHVCHFGHIGHCFYCAPEQYRLEIEEYAEYGLSRTSEYTSADGKQLIRPPITST